MSNPYTSPSISGYNSNPPPDDGSTGADNEIKWATHKDKLADPIKNYVDAIDSNVSTAFGKTFLNTITAVSSNYTVQASDRGKLISASNTITVTLLAAASATDGYAIMIANNGSGVVTVDGDGSETINGALTVILSPGESIIIVTQGSSWLGTSATGSSSLSANATGTVNAITATFSPPLGSLINNRVVYVRAAGANSISNPTFAPDGLTAKTIVKSSNDQLGHSNISGADHEIILKYNSTLDKWMLLNPDEKIKRRAVSSGSSLTLNTSISTMVTGSTGTTYPGGQYILAFIRVTGTKGGTSGEVVLTIDNTGTAGMTFNGGTSAKVYRYVLSGDTFEDSFCVGCHISSSGTLGIRVQGVSNGSDLTSASVKLEVAYAPEG